MERPVGGALAKLEVGSLTPANFVGWGEEVRVGRPLVAKAKKLGSFTEG
jgi:hypothetical protein